MPNKKSSQLARALPAAVTLISLTLAATVRVERACGDTPVSSPAVVYPYSEILAVRSALP